MGKKEKELTTKQERFITAYLTTKTLKAALAKTKISQTTYYNWLRENELFTEKLKEEIQKTFNEARQQISRATIKAVKVLEDLLASDDKNQRRLTAGMILDYAYKDLKEDIPGRVEKLERIILERRTYEK
jgi:phage terminase small subunit